VALHAHELHEKAEDAHARGKKGIGLTIAVLAVFSALVTMLLTETSTDKLIIETKIADWWAYSHSNDSNARLYDINAKVAELNSGSGAAVAAELRRERDRQRKESDDARLTAQKLERESAALTRKGNFYSMSELSLQFSVVLCSIALLTDIVAFWKFSFISTIAGLLLAGVGVFLH
jgi:hypothetical protein